VAPAEYDLAAVKPKWTVAKAAFFDAFALLVTDNASPLELEEEFKALAGTHQFKPGELMLPLRIMLVGGKFGPGVFDIALALGAAETVQRIKNALTAFN
jgi:glutamyl-tRNA synthetase